VPESHATGLDRNELEKADMVLLAPGGELAQVESIGRLERLYFRSGRNEEFVS
jgi:hypothetical protein